MKLICPKCLSNLQVPDAQVPADGGWARCPKCGERFFVKSSGGGLDQMVEDSRRAKPVRGRDAATQELINRMKMARGEALDNGGVDPADKFSTLVTIFPTPGPAPVLYQVMGIILLSVPLLAIVFVLATSKQPETEPYLPPDIRQTEFSNDFKPEVIRLDLVNIRRYMRNQRRVPNFVDYSGSESRVFKYFASLLIPGVCDQITRLELKTEWPAKGFEATGQCEGGILKKITMQVVWDETRAIISFPGYSKKPAEVEMYPVHP